MSALLSKAMAQAQADAFHPGEQAMQLLAGSRARMAEIGQRVIRDFMPDQHRELFEKLPYLFVGSLDAQGRPWASMLVGRPGFVQTPDERHMIVAAKPAPGDPLADHLRPGAPIAVIGIELHTRRRNRMNGRIAAREDDGFTIQVDQSFGNCPQYIQARQPFFRASPQSFSEPHPVETESALLSAEAAAMVRNADTFFIATASASAGNDERHEGVDVSHRGGRPGFVRVTEEDGCSVLTAPDFAGNNFFNTLGNIAQNPKAGLIFADFETGDLLQVTGAASIVLEDPEIECFPGALRLLRIEVEEGRLIRGAIPFRWDFSSYAPQLARTGVWERQTL